MSIEEEAMRTRHHAPVAAPAYGDLTVSTPALNATTKVYSYMGTKYVCVEGSDAYDPSEAVDRQVGGRVYPGSDASVVPDTYPSTDPLIIAVNVNPADGTFNFNTLSTFVLGADSSLGLPGKPNILALWPQYSDYSWGPPTKVAFKGKTSTSGTECGTGYGCEECDDESGETNGDGAMELS